MSGSNDALAPLVPCRPGVAALRIGQEAVEWLVGWLRFYRLDLMPSLRQAATELDAGRAPKVIDEEEELERIDANGGRTSEAA